MNRSRYDTIEDLLASFPKNRHNLSPEYAAIYDRHYSENRNASTIASKGTRIMESWGHRKVAKSVLGGGRTLEIGAGTLNQLDYEEVSGLYDIVEPKHDLYEASPNKNKVDSFYDDIREIPSQKMYDRITSCCTFEHILDLPDVLSLCKQHLKNDGIMSVTIPNEGRFLWHFAYSNTTGREFKRRYGLNYDVIMHYEHVNTADEIETLIRHFFKCVKVSLFGINKDFAFYRHFRCKK